MEKTSITIRAYKPLFLTTHIKNIQKNSFKTFLLLLRNSSSFIKFIKINSITIVKHAENKESCADVKANIGCIGKQKNSIVTTKIFLFNCLLMNNIIFQITYNEHIICKNENKENPTEKLSKYFFPNDTKI